MLTSEPRRGIKVKGDWHADTLVRCIWGKKVELNPFSQALIMESTKPASSSGHGDDGDGHT